MGDPLREAVDKDRSQHKSVALGLCELGKILSSKLVRNVLVENRAPAERKNWEKGEHRISCWELVG
jgi:hypothetical protein